MFATKRTVKEIKAPFGKIFISYKMRNWSITFLVLLIGINPAMAAQASANAGSAVDKLELAKKLASKITFSKNSSFDTKFATQQAAESILKG